MILPIYLYGHPMLNKKTQDIPLDYPRLGDLLNNMFETMYNAEGVGIAAPQIGVEYRVFIVDLSLYAGRGIDYNNFKKVFINPQVIERIGNKISIQEGCLSIPNICEKVIRNDKIRIKYFNENLQLQDDIFVDYPARVIQHEYDHLNGILFTNYIVGIRKQMIRNKLDKIMNGKIECSYRTVRFFK
ncbi:MAG: peptide deformylase [Candidatus Azobacteroides pseudotrichonymphae]|jgi:peptide deformylase|uniref:peptide deformylase n=1 Tax=Candidatus Azobacteroides pseudotrichonymphae TaxID=511435 RepID=UPI000319E024|nr:peptide deformylase [Candidatus Azobacteroides pseudotrichonymphae]MDR0530312.1 peptide deformylase [Bacteroidales bacterium OttesenSCG-928-I14]GMO35785.1 MAG: peptide deformylase [Candidatus Azobacteroides pseudotrichonymphae]